MALTDKVLMLGVDGLDPSLTRKFVDQGKLPNIKKFIERGAQKKDLKLLCTPPTITPTTVDNPGNRRTANHPSDHLLLAPGSSTSGHCRLQPRQPSLQGRSAVERYR